MTSTVVRAADGELSAGQAEGFARDGYLIAEGLLSGDEMARLRQESVRACRSAPGAIDGAEPLPAGISDAEVLRRFLCIHFPHKLSALWQQTMAHPALVRMLRGVMGPDIKAMQSMLFIKAEGKPGQAWHQDEYFIPTRDRSLTAAWIALDDATVDNGCVWVLPGSHRPGVLYPEKDIDDDRFDCTTEAYHFPYADTDAVPVELAAGSAVIFNGYLLHRSLPNTTSNGLRRSVVYHYMSTRSLLPWRVPGPGEHMAMTDDRDIVLISGTDPYAWKGTAERHRAYLRPDRDGGCER